MYWRRSIRLGHLVHVRGAQRKSPASNSSKSYVDICTVERRLQKHIPQCEPLNIIRDKNMPLKSQILIAWT